jgi:hypothetical protein
MKFKKRNLNKHTDSSLKIMRIWTEKEAKILKGVERITGLRIKTDKITCYIDSSTTNGYYGGKSITLGVKGGIDEDDVLMVITHELFHIFYWQKVKQLKLSKSTPGKESKTEWELAEVAAYLLTKDTRLKRCWPQAKVYLYPEIKTTYLKVRKFWKKGNLDEFLYHSYKLIK